MDTSQNCYRLNQPHGYVTELTISNCGLSQGGTTLQTCNRTTKEHKTWRCLRVGSWGEFLETRERKSSVFWGISPCRPLILKPRFRKNMSPQSSWSKNKQSRKPAWKELANKSFCFHAGFLLGLYFEPEMEAIYSSERSVVLQRPTKLYIPEDKSLHNHRCDNLKSYKEKSNRIEKPALCWSVLLLLNKTRRNRWVRHVTRKRQMTYTNLILVGKPEGKRSGAKTSV
jgi:hypothetical protein